MCATLAGCVDRHPARKHGAGRAAAV